MVHNLYRDLRKGSKLSGRRGTGGLQEHPVSVEPMLGVQIVGEGEVIGGFGVYATAKLQNHSIIIKNANGGHYATTFKFLCRCLRARRPIKLALISGFINMKRLGVFLLPPDGMLVHRKVTPSISLGTHLYVWVERGTMGVKFLAQEHNTMSPARTRTRTTRSAVEHHIIMRPPHLPPTFKYLL